MKVALIQMSVTRDNDQNVAEAIKRIEKAVSNKIDMAILPEMFCCPYENESFALYAQLQSGKNVSILSQVARENNIYLVAGSMPEKDTEGKIYNTSYVFDRLGALIGKHRKVHLFDIDIEGGQYFKESDTLTAGNEITVFETEFGKFGLAICFDMRFCELSRIMALENVRGIISPSAFNMTTGPMHWELLYRSRAVDNQLFTIAVAPARDNKSSYQSYGNSLIVNPWGEVIARLAEKDEDLYCELDLSQIERTRAQLPILHARRDDLYRVEKA